ncbi:MAG: ABC transporter substrate-binding protein [Bacteroidales bacterium]|jgi:iron complex transport system substrate-binding protein|nr:ABC transporter substrate-binding protein [Bacteroidales bacterium]
MKKILFYLFFAVIVSCNNHNSHKQRAQFCSIEDSYNREVVLSHEPQRIISLSPGITEMVYLLHSEEKLVGVTDFCNFPEAAKKIDRVGGLNNFSIEQLLNLHPDLVLIGSIVQKEDVEKIESLQIPVIALKAEQHVADILHSIQLLGQILNQQDLAQEKIEIFQQKIDHYHLVVQHYTAAPTVCYMVGFGEGGDYVAPQNSHIHDIITLAGGKNIGLNLTGWSISREFLFKENPDFIFIRRENYEQFCTSFPYSELNAVKNHQVFPIESGWMDIVSPRMFLAIDYISELINH